MSNSHQRPHILVVSDDTDLSGFLGQGLVYAGCWTSVIASAIQTIEVFRLRTFDLMLVDANLDGLGARELLRRLRGIGDRPGLVPMTDIPIVVIAASEAEMSADEAEGLGADTIVYPPVELEDLGPFLLRTVLAWREGHPDRPWADVAAQQRPAGPDTRRALDVDRDGSR
jgi:DNA-binding response OmpR family regulator